MTPVSINVLAGTAHVELPHKNSPKTHCRVFEDNAGALELANTHKSRPRTKHLAAQLHHFRQCILDKTIKVEKIATTYQRADMFAKALPRVAFRSLRRTLIGWQSFARECHDAEIMMEFANSRNTHCVFPAAPLRVCRVAVSGFPERSPQGAHNFFLSVLQ